MGKFLTEVKSQPPKLKHQSHFRRAYEALPKEEREDFANAVRDRSIPLTAIKRVLELRGIKISTCSLSRARNGEILDGV